MLIKARVFLSVLSGGVLYNVLLGSIFVFLEARGTYPRIKL